MDNKETKKQQYEKYISQYDIEKTITEMLNSLVHDKSSEPIVFMIKYLAGILTDEQRNKYNISIPGPYPLNIPLVKFPELDGNTSLLRSHLTRRIWQHIKYNKSKQGATIMEVINLNEEKNGIILPDGDCLRMFGLLLEPMLRTLNPDIDHEAGDNGFQDSFSKVRTNIQKIVISYSRNVKDFNFMSTTNAKQLEQIEGSIRYSIEQLENEKALKSGGRLLSVKDNENEIRNALAQVLDYDKFIKELERLNLKRGKGIITNRLA
jgi:hypothetical protein